MKGKKIRITVKVACDSCGATGLYKGFGEAEGVAVVCLSCDGTGEETVEVEGTKFMGKVKVRGVKKVFEVNPGIRLVPVHEGGMSYKEWWALGRKGKFPEGRELRGYTCPAWWYQTTNSDRGPEWKECVNVGTFRECACFKSKDKCWARFDKEGI